MRKTEVLPKTIVFGRTNKQTCSSYLATDEWASECDSKTCAHDAIQIHAVTDWLTDCGMRRSSCSNSDCTALHCTSIRRSSTESRPVAHIPQNPKSKSGASFLPSSGSSFFPTCELKSSGLFPLPALPSIRPFFFSIFSSFPFLVLFIPFPFRSLFRFLLLSKNRAKVLIYILSKFLLLITGAASCAHCV